MRVTFKVYTYLKAEISKGELVVNIPEKDSARLDELFDQVSSLVGRNIKEKLIKDGKLREGIILVINGKVIPPVNAEEIIVKDGDTLSLLPPGSGG